MPCAFCIIIFRRCGGTADALVSGSSEEIRVGSNPVTCTISSVHNESDEHSILFCLSFQILCCL